jgi:hypothetical protein
MDRNEREVRLFKIEETSPLTDIKLVELLIFVVYGQRVLGCEVLCL